MKDLFYYVFYRAEKNSQLKGWLVFAYVIGSLVLYFVSLFIY